MAKHRNTGDLLATTLIVLAVVFLVLSALQLFVDLPFDAFTAALFVLGIVAKLRKSHRGAI